MEDDMKAQRRVDLNYEGKKVGVGLGGGKVGMEQGKGISDHVTFGVMLTRPMEQLSGRGLFPTYLIAHYE